MLVRVTLDSEPDPAARAMFDAVFGAEFTEEDWRHALGGTHAHAYDGDALVGHGAVVPRTLWQNGRAYRTGYVEGVAVAASHRRRGVGRALMGALQQVIEDTYELGALAATDDGAALYAALGWTPVTGFLGLRHANGRVEATPEEIVFVRGAVDPAQELLCEPRPGDVW